MQHSRHAHDIASLSMARCTGLADAGAAYAAVRGRRNRLALHVAAACGASAAVIGEQLVAYPEGAKARDSDGLLPLHHAVLSRATPPVLTRLLDSHPPCPAWECADLLRLEALGEGPLRHKLRAEPWRAAIPDADGRLPLHHALSCDAPAEVVELLVMIHPGACRKQDRHARLPLHYAMMRELPAVSSIEALLRAYPEARTAGFGDRPYMGTVGSQDAILTGTPFAVT